MSNIICEKAYLYSLHKGRLIVYEGRVQEYPNPDPDELFACFYIGKSKSDSRKVNREPEMVYNGNVWTPEDNLDKAVDLLVDNAISKMKCLTDEVNKLTDLVFFLRSLKTGVLK